jgi:hypothetical protein
MNLATYRAPGRFALDLAISALRVAAARPVHWRPIAGVDLAIGHHELRCSPAST